MNYDNEKALVEAILFLETEPIEIDILAKISKLSRDTVLTILALLKEDYKNNSRGIYISEQNSHYSLNPKQHLWENLKDRYGKRNEEKLSRAALETLSIIAYSQPITRFEIENLRGVSPDGMIRLLIQKELIKEVGKKDVPGKPVQYGTTKDFLKLFKLNSISELPKLDEVEKERFELNG